MGQQGVVAGVLWLLSGRFVKVTTRFVTTVVLARLLTPEDFGLVAMVLVFLGFVNRLSEMGLGHALIQREELTEDHRSSVFWLTTGVGVTMALGLWLCADLMADFYRSPNLVPVARGLAVVALLSAMAVVPNSITRRDMAFRRLTGFQAPSDLVNGGVAISGALLGYGVFSLVAGSIAGALANLTGLLIAAKWLPALRFRWTAVKEVLGFGLNLMGAQTLIYWTQNADNLLVGRYHGMAELGAYSRAYQAMLMPMQNLTSMLRQALFPHLSRLQREPERLRREFVTAISTLALVSLPVSGGIAAVSEEFVIGLYGPQWEQAVPVLRILAWVGAVQGITSVGSLAFVVTGRTDVQLRWQLVKSPVMIGAFLLVAPISIIAVAWSYLGVVLLASVPNMWLACRLLEIRTRSVAEAVLPAAGCTLLMSACVYGLGSTFPGGHPLLRLAVLVPVGVLVYVAAAWVVQPPGLAAVVETLRRKLGR